MNDPNAFGYQGTPGAPSGPSRSFPGGPNAMAQYKFSTEEMHVLQECNRESFFKRSVPIAMGLGLGTFAALQKGFLRPNPRFGAFPKMSLAVAVGYFIGKLSYQQACAEKLMALPGSYIGQLLRDRRDGKIGGEQMRRESSGASGMLGAGAADIYSDAGPGSSLNLDTDRPAFSDDSYRPDNESGASGAEAAPAGARPALSYDELRRRNRGEHADAKQDPYRVEGAPAPGGRRAPPPPPPPVAPRPPATNRYGDALD